MSEYMVGATDGRTFDFDDIVAGATQHWQGSEFFPARGQQATVSYGQIEIPDGLNVGLLASRGGMVLDGAPDSAADFVAWLTTRSDFPDNESAVICNWASDLVPLRPNMTAEDLLAVEGP